MAQKIKKASTSDTIAEALASVNAKKVNEWKRFLEISQEQKNVRNGDKGKQVYLDSDILKTLEKLKISGIGFPVRYMANAALRVFLESNADKMNEQLAKL